MQITYNTSILRLEDLPLDVGYASEKVNLKSSDGSLFSIGGQNGATQLLITAPYYDDALGQQLKELTDLIELNALSGTTKSLAFSKHRNDLPLLSEWMIGNDYDDGLGDYYGIRISSGELEGELAKALFIISKDGALFYSHVLDDLNKPFDIEKAVVKIAAAQNCYTGKGCHG